MLALTYPAVMGILNVTPDSFSDGGKYLTLTMAVNRALEMVREGAAIIDIGGESTRPGAATVSVDEELRRVVPVIEAIRHSSDIPISVDTSTPEVIEAAAAAGADLINDVRALRRPGALAAAAATDLPICLMHMQGDPASMQLDPHYEDLIAEVRSFFEERIEACAAAGVARERLWLDPGFGFGKTPKHNLQLINRLGEFVAMGLPILVGLSRKSTIAKVLDDPDNDRLFGSVAGAVMAVVKGASIVRVHDVRPTVEALRVAIAIMDEG